jgi:NAD(P)H-dependent flavin oxidoreductase YrpB (nitropropane dioxygenase family)
VRIPWHQSRAGLADIRQPALDGRLSLRTTDTTAGQTAGGIREILPVAEIMRRLVAEAEATLSRAEDFR